MSIELKIILSAVAVVALGFVIWLILMLKDGRKLRGQRMPIGYPTTARDREEYAQMQKLRDEVGPLYNEEGHSNEDDSTVTLPGPEQLG